MKNEMCVWVRGEVCRTISDGYEPHGMYSLEGMGGSCTNVPLSFSAKIWVSTENASVQRDFCVTYTSPEGLAGVSVACTQGEYTLSVPLTQGEPLCFATTQAQVAGLLKPLVSLLPKGDVTNVTAVANQQVSVTLVAADGSQNTLLYDVQNKKDISIPMVIQSKDDHGWLKMSVSLDG